ncbi:ExbD/TolR family protein [Trinickia sp.]|uniref:ExbD/TolR family protein n=1 Tax=Trinickia sp. TaxID=2571163 RepID=UPI003F80BC5A
MSRTRYFEAREPRIEIIPMIDIMMFLLIFFMVTMLKMVETNGITIAVPQSTTATQLPTQSMTISVRKDGAMFFDNHVVDAAALTQAMSERRRSAKLDVLVAGDKDVPLQVLLNVMDIARAAGVDDVSIAAKH